MLSIKEFSMFQDKVNDLLEQYARANDGTNHGSDYAFYNLPTADSLGASLELHFAQYSTSRTPAQPGKAWNIRMAAIKHPDDVLLEVAQRWFFGLNYSPDIPSSMATEEILNFVINLRGVVGNAPLFEVNVTPPLTMWYECVWQDFAFDGQEQRWLLHLGFSD